MGTLCSGTYTYAAACRVQLFPCSIFKHDETRQENIFILIFGVMKYFFLLSSVRPKNNK
jgi:hypothetical protein